MDDIQCNKCDTVDGICGHTGSCRDCAGFCKECDTHEIEDFKSTGCPKCGSDNCTPLNQYKDEHEIGWQVECNECEAFWDEPTMPLEYTPY